MHDPETLIFEIGPLSLWHRDPCRDGSDDSCGYCMRARHGKPEVFKKIYNAILFEWNCHYQPLFHENGDPALSTMAIAVNCFWHGSFHYFGGNSRRAARWMQSNLFSILLFGESTVDTLATSINGRFGEDKQPKTQRVHEMASIVYGWMLRTERPWWKHPRWHVHHWRLHCRPFWKSWLRKSQSREAMAGGAK